MANTETKVDLFIPRGGPNEDPNYPIIINGTTFLLPKGKTSKVPKYVKDEYDRCQRATERLDETVDRLLAIANTPFET